MAKRIISIWDGDLFWQTEKDWSDSYVQSIDFVGGDSKTGHPPHWIIKMGAGRETILFRPTKIEQRDDARD